MTTAASVRAEAAHFQQESVLGDRMSAPLLSSLLRQGSEPESGLRSVSEAGLEAAAAPLHSEPAAPPADDDVTKLREQFQLQQTKLRRMEQKNYVSCRTAGNL